MSSEAPESSAFDARDWYLAATLVERAGLAPGAATSAPEAERAARRDRRWRAQDAFAGAAMFELRLQTDGLTRDAFLRILGESPRAAEAPAPPSWAQTFKRSFASSRAAPAAEAPGLWPLVAPLADEALRRACAIARAHDAAEGPIPSGSLESLLSAALPRDRLRTIAARTVVLEVNVARLRGEISGATSEERYADFLQRLAEPECAARLLASYPVLARQVVEALDAWVTCQAELIARLRADWDVVRAALLANESPGALVEISAPQGDLHRGGRAVLILRFAGGQRLVYKPRSLASEAHFQALLEWLNARTSGPQLAAPEVLDRGAYGWCTFAAHAPCANEDELRAFYMRLGGLAAVLTILDATDMHSENLIAAGAQPLLVDLECLFQPRAYVHLDTDGAALPAADEFHTVLRTGILPTRTWLEGGHAGVDTSALGAVNGQALPDPNLALADAGTDTLHFVSARATLDGPARHAPAIAPSEGAIAARPEDYEAPFVAGFSAVYRCAIAHRDELLAPEGPLAAFAQDEVRVLVRDTRTYGLLLDDAFHPDYLRDALERDRLFDRLWADVARRPYLAPLVPSEQADLHDRDVPMFTTRPASHDLWDSRGRCIPGLFQCSSLALVRRQIARLSENDLARQTWAIRASLDTLRMNRGEPFPSRASLATASNDIPVRPALLSMARAIGDHLDALAMRGEKMACWAGVLARRGAWTADIVDHSLHSGTGGIALFLAHLAKLTGDPKYRALARQAAEAVCIVVAKRCRDGIGPSNNPGLDYGWGGVFYVLASLGVEWPDLASRYADLLLGLVPIALTDVARHPVADVAQGASGCLLGLLVTWRAFRESRFRDAAIICGDRVFALAPHDASGGLARGSAGIAHALNELSRESEQARFGEAAQRLFGQERSTDTDAEWASGAAGAGLVRLAALRHLPKDSLDPMLVADLAGSIANVVSAPYGNDHSVARGDLGRLELLLQARARTSLGAMATFAGGALDSHLERLVAEVSARGWMCGLPSGRETPGLMTGLAGIGYQLLRMVAPDRVTALVVGA